jgi:hypothetical protein
MDGDQILIQQYLFRLDVLEPSVEVLLIDKPRAAVVGEDFLGNELLVIFVGVREVL